MKIVASRVSVYELQLDLSEWGPASSSEVPGFAGALVDLLPSLTTHKCMSGEAGGFLAEVRAGTNFAHIVEHVLLELLHLSNPSSSYTGWTRQLGPQSYVVHYSAPDFIRGRLAAVVAIECTRALLKGRPIDLPHYLDVLRHPDGALAHDDEIIRAAMGLRAPGGARASPGPAPPIELSAERMHRIAALLTELASELPAVTEQWQAAFAEYAGAFGRSLLDRLALVNPDRLLAPLRALDLAGYNRVLGRAGLLLAATAVPRHFIVQSLWLYKTPLLDRLAARFAGDTGGLSVALTDLEVLFQSILHVVSDALVSREPGSAMPAVADFRELGDEAAPVLIVDDDDMVRHVCRELLRHHGYRTATARDGAEALRVVAGSEQDVRGVVLDVRLRGMESHDLYRHLRTMRPGLPVLVITGYPITPDLRALYPGDLVAWLQKPFARKDFLATAERILGAPCRVQ